MPIYPNLRGIARAFLRRTSLYIGHIAPRPLLMLNGRQDTTVVKAATDLLYKAAGDPKQIRWFDSGHILPGEAVGEGIAWLADKLHAGH